MLSNRFPIQSEMYTYLIYIATNGIDQSTRIKSSSSPHFVKFALSLHRKIREAWTIAMLDMVSLLPMTGRVLNELAHSQR